MRKSIIITALITILVLLFFENIEMLALKCNLSWTIAKILPYSLLVVAGIVLFRLVSKLNFKKGVIKYLTGLLCLLLPFGIGFSLHPIYEGDFSSIGKSDILNISPKDFQKDGLLVATIVDCPYCLNSIDKLKKIKERNPNLHIEFVVCTKDKKYIKTYVKEVGGKFVVRMANNSDSLALMTGYRFPAFIHVKNNQPAYIWSNDQFGAGAIDNLENSTNKN